MFRYRCQLRRWAARVLFLWLLGVASGGVNACLGPSLADGNGQRSNTPWRRSGHYMNTGHRWRANTIRVRTTMGSRVSPHHDETQGKTNCEDF